MSELPSLPVWAYLVAVVVTAVLGPLLVAVVTTRAQRKPLRRMENKAVFNGWPGEVSAALERVQESQVRVEQRLDATIRQQAYDRGRLDQHVREHGGADR